MTVAELIEILRKAPQGHEVLVGFDSMVCLETPQEFWLGRYDSPYPDESVPHVLFICVDDDMDMHAGRFGAVKL